MMTTDVRSLYLDLLKKTLSFLLWSEPPRPVETFSFQYPPLKRFVIETLSGILKTTRLRLVEAVKVSDKQRESGEIWPVYAVTMIGLKRLDNIQACIETVLRDNVPGDLIETGVWRGGGCIFMRGVLAANGAEGRRVFVADSFEGLPKPEEDKFPSDKGDTHYQNRYLAVSKEEVEANFKKYGLLDDSIVFLKGWFKDTLPTAPIKQLAILRLDGDMYSSTMDAISALYPKLAPGGFCIVDDYALKGCREAIDDYRAQHGITAPIERIDEASAYWRNPISPAASTISKTAAALVS